MQRILVTGGAGFIGSNLVRHLIQEKRTQLINLDRLTYAGNLNSLSDLIDNPLHVFVEGDICNRELLDKLLRDFQPDAIVHLAAESHVDRSIDGPAEFVQTNVVGTFTMLEAARNYWKTLESRQQNLFRFLHVSTDEVYGSLGSTGQFTESTPYSPSSPYSASKAASDHFVRAYHCTYGLPVLVTNCSNNYGPFQFPEKLIPLMILNALEGKTLPVYGDGQQVRDWLYVGDHCRAIRAVLDRGTPGETYNIGGNCEKTNLDIVKGVCTNLDNMVPNLTHAPCESLISHVQDRPGHDRRYAIDASKILRETGWKPVENFETGLAKTIAWYLDNQSWVEQITTGVYQRERLGGVAVANSEQAQ